MIRFFLLLSLISTPLYAEKVIKKNYSSKIEDGQAKACSIAFGVYRRETKAHCEKAKLKLNYAKLDVSKCIKKKVGPGRYLASYDVSFECKK